MENEKRRPLALRCPDCGSEQLAEFATVPLVCRKVTVWRDGDGELRCETDGSATRVCWDGYLHAGVRCEDCDHEGAADDFVCEPLAIAGRYVEDPCEPIAEAAERFARDLMRGDPAACKTGYSPANAAVAARAAFALARRQYDRVREAIGAQS